MGFMEKMMDWKIGKMSKEEKLAMMPKMMEDLGPEDMMAMMSRMMPKMMEHCLTPMTAEERAKLFAGCKEMLAGMEEKFPGE